MSSLRGRRALSSEIRTNHMAPSRYGYNNRPPVFSEVVLISSLCPVVFTGFQMFRKCRHVGDDLKISNIYRTPTCYSPGVQPGPNDRD